MVTFCVPIVQCQHEALDTDIMYMCIFASSMCHFTTCIDLDTTQELIHEVGEMAQWFRVCSVLKEDPSLILSAMSSDSQ